MISRLVVTNDDGIESEGLHVLARYLEQSGNEVTIIAPDHNASGTGAALGHVSASHPIRFKEWVIEDFHGTAYAINGPPALCALVASYGALGERPEVVVSGINAGMNLGRAALHSGTVGGALAAQNFGMKGLAVSVGVSNPWHWETAAQVAVEVLPSVLNGTDRTVTNLNVPAVPITQLKGTRWSHMAKYGSVRAMVTKVENDEIHVEQSRVDYQPQVDTDLAITREGFASISCIHGVSEVWNSEVAPGDLYLTSHKALGVSAGDRLEPTLSYFESQT